MTQYRRKLRYTRPAFLAFLTVVIFYFWNTIPMYPVKLFVILLHELSHGIAAVLTGGEITSIKITMDQGGVCYTIGGNRFIVLSAGYLGSILWGSLILFLSSTAKLGRHTAGLFGTLLLVTGIVFVSNLSGKIFTIVFAIIMIYSGYKAAEWFNEMFIAVIGLTSIFYTFFDIVSDSVIRNIPDSDASRLGDIYFGNSLFWGIIWTLLGGFFLIKLLPSISGHTQLESNKQKSVN